MIQLTTQQWNFLYWCSVKYPHMTHLAPVRRILEHCIYADEDKELLNFLRRQLMEEYKQRKK